MSTEAESSTPKVNSAEADTTVDSPKEEKKTRRASSKVAGVFDIAELGVQALCVLVSEADT